MRAMDVIKLLAPVAFVVGAAGPAAAAPSQTFPTTCEIDLTNLLPADNVKLPEPLQNQSFIVGEEVPFARSSAPGAKVARPFT